MRRGDSQNGRSPQRPRQLVLLRRRYYQGALLARPLWWAPWPNQGYTCSNGQTLRFSYTTQVVFHGLCVVQLCVYERRCAAHSGLAAIYPRSRRPVARNQPFTLSMPHRGRSVKKATSSAGCAGRCWVARTPGKSAVETAPLGRSAAKSARADETSMPRACRPLYQLSCHGCDPTPHPSPGGAVAVTITRAPVTASRSTTFSRRFTPRCPPLI